MTPDTRLDAYLLKLAKRMRKVKRALTKTGRPFAEGELDSLVRRTVTEADPLAFALIYLLHHLKSGLNHDGDVTLSDVHWAWVNRAKGWMTAPTEPYESRHAEVGPRDVGKSTWNFLILPMWAAAHGHVKFAAAFSSTPTQAENHLASFKAELDNNVLLRADYATLCEPRTRGRGQVAADRVSLYHAKSGFVFAAAGMDSSNLGMKVGALRPDLIVLDDIEPHEGQYSAALARKRLGTLLDAILPLNIYARVVLVGTVTLEGSIVHQLVKSAKGEQLSDDESWIAEQRFIAHHYPAIIENDDGTRRSVWPSKWSLAFLESIEGTRTYAKNYANDPLGADGDYWTPDLFLHGDLPGVSRRVISIDPNVTQKATSDYTGIGVVGWAPSTNRCRVDFATQVKMQPDKLRDHVLLLIAEYRVGLLIIEVNQGGDLWLKVFHDMPIRVKVIHQSEPKEVRAADVLHHYELKKVVHAKGLGILEGQMVAFPNAPHDDMVDAVGTAVRFFLSRKRKQRTGAERQTYIS